MYLKDFTCFTSLYYNQCIDCNEPSKLKDRSNWLIGYARVSSADQVLDLQIDALLQAGCDRIFKEKLSSVKAKRPELDAAIDFLRPGDTLVVWRLDRLGRSLKDLIEIVSLLKDRGIAFKTLTEGIDTSTSGGS